MSYYLKDLIDLRKNFIKAYDSKKYSDALDYGTKIIDLYKDNNACKTEDYADDLYNLAVICDDMHISDRAKGYYKESAKLKKDLLGENSQSYFDSLTNLGVLHSILGEYDEAEEILKTVSNQIKDYTGINTSDYVESLYNLGNMYTDEEKYDLGISTLTEALECAKRVKNYAPSEYIDIHVSIAEACAKSGNYRRACDEYARAKKLSDRENETNTYFKMNYLVNYSNVLQRLEKYDDAATIYSDAINIREEIMSIHHLDFISMLNNLAAIYNKNDEFDKSMEIHNRVLALVEKMLGKNHVFYGDVLTNIGIDYSGLEDYDKAVEYHNKALDIKRNIVGEKHQHYIFTLMSLADTYEDMGKYSRSIDIQNTAMELRTQCFGEINEHVCDSLMNLGRLYMESDDLIKAQGFLMRALIMGKEIMIAGISDVRCYAETVRLMAEACGKKDDKEKAIQFCEKYISLKKTKYGNKHPKYARALYDSAMIFDQIENYSKASEYLDTASDIAESMCGTDTLFCMECLYHSGEMFYKIKNYTDAYERLKRAAAVYKKNSDDYDELIKIMYLQAKTQYMLGFPKKAEECILRADGIASRNDVDPNIITDEKIQYAHMMIEGNDYEKACVMLESIYENIGMCCDSELIFELLKLSSEAYYNCNKYEQAILKAEEGIKHAVKDMDVADIKIILAKSLCRSGDFVKTSEILEDLKILISENEKVASTYNTLVYCMLGDSYNCEGKTDKSDKSFDIGIKSAKERNDISEIEYIKYLKLAAGVSENLNNYSKAVEYVSEGALLIRKNEGENEKFAGYIIHTAELYNKSKRYSEAVVMFEKALEMYSVLYGNNSEKYIDITIDLCKTYERCGRTDSVIENLERFKNLGYKKNEIKSLLANAYRKKGSITKLLRLKLSDKQ